MTIADFYGIIDADYNEVMGHLVKEDRVYKYLNRFVEENMYAIFDKAYSEGNYEEAFRATHSLKGMCLNLGFSKLESASSDVCEELRHGAPKIDISEMIEIMKIYYDEVVDNIKKITI